MAQPYRFKDDGVVPNNPVLPVVVMAGTDIDSAAEARDRFHANGWGGTWESTVFDYTHYHPGSHEALICIAGWADIQLGGDKGREFRLTPGDCVVLPAGTGHRCLASGSGFLVVGAYPPGQEDPEIRRATSENYAGTTDQVAGVALPKACPIGGPDGPTIQAWTNP